jgi:hypothetical protein
MTKPKTLIAVSSIDPEELAKRHNKEWKDIVVLAAKKFKIDYEGGYFDKETMAHKLYEYVSKMVQEEIEDCLRELVQTKKVSIKNVKGEDIIWVPKKKKRDDTAILH